VDELARLVAHREIADLLGNYCMLFDDADWNALEELWTEDAEFLVDGVGFVGRDAVMRFLSSCLPAGYRSKHLISPPLIDLAVDGLSASARTDVIWIAQNFHTEIIARYEDDLVCQDGRWRIRRRNERPLEHRPGPPPMSEDASRVSRPTMRKP
jgi:hypothetical protein